MSSDAGGFIPSSLGMNGNSTHHHTHHENRRSSYQLPPIIPTPSLIEAVAGAGHYLGANPEHHDAHPVGRKSTEKQRTGPAVEVNERRKLVLEDLKELFCCRPTKEIFDRSWRNDAVFEDPLCHCEGRSEYAAQWYGLAKVAKSHTVSSRIISSTVSPNRIVYFQKQEYAIRLIGKKVIQSMVVVDLDEEDKIVRLSDEWDGEEPSRVCLARAFRRLNAKMVKWTVKIPRNQR